MKDVRIVNYARLFKRAAASVGKECTLVRAFTPTRSTTTTSRVVPSGQWWGHDKRIHPWPMARGEVIARGPDVTDSKWWTSVVSPQFFPEWIERRTTTS